MNPTLRAIAALLIATAAAAEAQPVAANIMPTSAAAAPAPPKEPDHIYGLQVFYPAHPRATGYRIVFHRDAKSWTTRTAATNATIWFTNEYPRLFADVYWTNRIGQQGLIGSAFYPPHDPDRALVGYVGGRPFDFDISPDFVHWKAMIGPGPILFPFSNYPNVHFRRPPGITNQWFINRFNPLNK